MAERIKKQDLLNLMAEAGEKGTKVLLVDRCTLLRKTQNGYADLGPEFDNFRDAYWFLKGWLDGSDE